jgi:hypothetical protein
MAQLTTHGDPPLAQNLPFTVNAHVLTPPETQHGLERTLRKLGLWTRMRDGQIIVLQAARKNAGRSDSILARKAFRFEAGKLLGVPSTAMETNAVSETPIMIFETKEDQPKTDNEDDDHDDAPDESLWDSFWNWLTSGTNPSPSPPPSPSGLEVGPFSVSIGGVNPTAPGVPPIPSDPRNPAAPPFAPTGMSICITILRWK